MSDIINKKLVILCIIFLFIGVNLTEIISANGKSKLQINNLSLNEENLCAYSSSGDELDKWGFFSVNLQNTYEPYLRFSYQYNISKNQSDFGYVKISNDDGESWEIIKTFQGNKTYWYEKYINLKIWINQTILIGFQFMTEKESISEGWYLDNIYVMDRNNLIFNENFQDYDFNDYWIDWLIVEKENCPDIWVDDDYTEISPGWGITHFNLIQNAINKSSQYDYIKILDGYYNELIEIEKIIDIIGNGTFSTILDGGFEPCLSIYETNFSIYINASKVKLKNCHITGGGIEINGDNVEVSYCNFLNNDFAVGFFTTTGARLNNNVFMKNNLEISQRVTLGHSHIANISNNFFYESSTAIWLYGSSDIEIYNNTIINSTSEGIGLFSSDYNEIVKNTIIGDGVLNNGIYMTNSLGNNITNNLISYCNIGILIEAASHNTIQFNEISFCVFSISSGYTVGNFITNNNLIYSTSGIEIIASFSFIIATNNWWGDIQGGRNKVRSYFSIVITLFSKNKPIELD